MATASFPLRRIQFAMESTAGTLAEAEAQLAGEGVYTPLVARWRPDFSEGACAWSALDAASTADAAPCCSSNRSSTTSS